MSGISSPLQLGPILLRNRNIMSALTRNRALPTTVPNDTMLEYYKQRAQGGAGLIVSEGALITRQGSEWEHAPGIWNDEHVAAWKNITDVVHEAGSHMFAQLWHLGRVNHPDMPEQKAAGTPVWAPSAIFARGGKFRTLPGQPGYVTPTEIPDPHIIVAQYKHAATKAKEAGFDGVELHAANGYLVHQFLDNTSNKRTDEWGGSVENRSRFLFEVVKALIEVWGADRVGVKLNAPGGYNDVGMSLEDTLETYTHAIKGLDEMRVAYVTLVRYVAAYDTSFDGKLRATQHDVVESYGSLFKNSKFFLNGGLTPSEADQLILDGNIDAAVFGIPWIGHPDLQRRIEQGKPLDAVLDFKHLYYMPGVALSVGYSDYPTAA
ncbi:FMN-linked oxidoreductase [Hysterangium stoloniferum]|nr:FMN-linked oxidoreductase [Hysterangium stoloniferum]